MHPIALGSCDGFHITHPHPCLVVDSARSIHPATTRVLTGDILDARTWGEGVQVGQPPPVAHTFTKCVPGGSGPWDTTPMVGPNLVRTLHHVPSRIRTARRLPERRTGTGKTGKVRLKLASPLDTTPDDGSRLCLDTSPSAQSSAAVTVTTGAPTDTSCPVLRASTRLVWPPPRHTG